MNRLKQLKPELGRRAEKERARDDDEMDEEEEGERSGPLTESEFGKKRFATAAEHVETLLESAREFAVSRTAVCSGLRFPRCR